MPRIFNKSRTWRSLLAASATILLASLGLSAPAQADSSQIDTVNQSVVFVFTSYPTTVTVPFGAGINKVYSFDNGQIGARCTGSIVSETGYVLTAAHCIQPSDDTKKFAIESTLQIMEDDPAITIGKPDLTLWDVAFGTPSVTVDQPQRNQQDAFKRGELDARIVDAQTFETGDNALLQLPGVKDLIALPVATSKPAVDESVKSFGFPALTDGATSSKLQDPTFKPLTITRHANSKKYATPIMEVDGEILPGMSGGPAVNADGAIVGVNSSGFDGMGVSYITDTDDTIKFLRDNNVTSVDAAGIAGNMTTESSPFATDGTSPAQAPAVGIAQDDNSGVSMMTMIAVVVIGVVLIGVIGLVLWFWSKKRSTRNASSGRRSAASPPVQGPDDNNNPPA